MPASSSYVLRFALLLMEVCSRKHMRQWGLRAQRRKLFIASLLHLVHSQHNASHGVSLSALMWIQKLFSTRKRIITCPRLQPPVASSLPLHHSQQQSLLHSRFMDRIRTVQSAWGEVDVHDGEYSSNLASLQSYQWSLQLAIRDLAVKATKSPCQTMLCFVSCYSSSQETFRAIRSRHQQRRRRASGPEAVTDGVVILLAVPWDEQFAQAELWDLRMTNDIANYESAQEHAEEHASSLTMTIVPVPFMVGASPTEGEVQKTHRDMWVDGMNLYIMGTLALILNDSFVQSFDHPKWKRRSPTAIRAVGTSTTEEVEMTRTSLEVMVIHHRREQLRSMQHGLFGCRVKAAAAGLGEEELRFDGGNISFSFLHAKDTTT
uniref:Uncharacterized protein n=1 Tax=Bodo saltans TaxID=75058 RepID=B6DT98_BODSA|nr:hypothetical protein [Bodo saltans]